MQRVQKSRFLSHSHLFLGTLLLFLVTACDKSPQKWLPSSNIGRPNVLLITLDTTRADRLGAYGFPLARTPNIDALAKEGVLCTDDATTAPITMVAHSSIMTGLFPPAHGVRDNGAYTLSDKAVTLAERFKESGYETHAAVSAAVLARRYNLTQGFDTYDDELWEEDKPPLFMIPDRPGPKTAKRVVDWLETWKSEPKHSPFFMWVHFFDPHQPYESHYEKSYLCPTPYDAEIAQADQAVGMLIDWLKKHNQLENTLVVLTADHGESLGEHGEKTHAIFIYDATIHVPLIWHFPKLFPPGTRYEGPVRSIDIMPTILAALNIPGVDHTQGFNLVPALQQREAPPELPQYCESMVAEIGFGMAPLFGVRMGGYKYIRVPKPELYDLHKDPREKTNIYSENPDIVKRMDAELSKITQASEARALTEKRNPMDVETMQMLQALGYLSAAPDAHRLTGMDPKDGMRIYSELEDARHFAQQERYADSENSLRDILTQIPGHITARNTLAFVLMREKKRDEAEKEYLTSLASDPTQSRVMHMLGFINLLKGNLDVAEQYYKKALAVTPRFVESIMHLGFVYEARGDLATAQQWYDKALQEDPSQPRANMSIADLYFVRDDYQHALEHYGKSLERTPENFQALVQAGVCADRLGQTDNAKTYYEGAVKIRPDSWIPEYNLACLFAKQGKADDAIAHFKLANAKCDAKQRFWDLLKTDTDLKSIRDLPALKDLQNFSKKIIPKVEVNTGVNPDAVTTH